MTIPGPWSADRSASRPDTTVSWPFTLDMEVREPDRPEVGLSDTYPQVATVCRPLSSNPMGSALSFIDDFGELHGGAFDERECRRGRWDG
jgi:hypothetical protein